jgi:hypothetical protein
MCFHIDPLTDETNSFQLEKPSLEQRSIDN